MNKYLKILEYFDKHFIYFFVPILPFYIDLFFPSILNLFTYDDYSLPTSIIGKIYILGYVFPLTYFIYIPTLAIEFFKNLDKILYTPLTVMQFIAMILLLIAMIDIEAMGYFTFLRIYIFLTALYTMYTFNKASKKSNNEEQENLFLGSALLAFIIAVLFNPIFPIYFWDKTPWYFIDSISAILFMCFVYFDDWRIPKD